MFDEATVDYPVRLMHSYKKRIYQFVQYLISI